MGRCGLVTNDQKGWLCGTGSILFRPDITQVDARFMVSYLSSSSVKAALMNQSVGATMDNLNTEILSKLSAVIPPMAEQKKILIETSLIENDLKKAEELEIEGIQKLNEFKQTLIAHAVTGKIRV